MALYGGIEISGRPDLENVRKLDLLPIPMIRRMHRLGFCISPPYFADLASRFSSEMRDYERDISSYIPPERLHEFSTRANDIEDADEDGLGQSSINANSAEQIGKLLFDMLGVGKDKELKLTKQGRVSTAKAQLRDLELDHPVVPSILAFKERAKLVNTYCVGLVKKAKFHPRSKRSSDYCPVCELQHDADTWRVHGECTTTRAETGRVQVKNPPLQTIPQRTKNGALVRAGFIASPGKRLCSVDFSQIELRMMAHLANCLSMIRVYEADKDLHTATAMDCFGLASESEVDKIKHRTTSKVANFLTQYGGSGKALYAQLKMAFLILISEGEIDRVPDWLTISWCEDFVVRWFIARPEVADYLDLQTFRVRRYGMAWDIFGRPRLVPEVRSVHSWIKEAGIRQAGNLADQGSSAGLLKIVMASVNDSLLQFLDSGIWCWPIVPVHDQLLVEADEDRADDVLEMMTCRFNDVMRDMETDEWRFRVPIKSDGGVLEKWEK